MRAVTKCRNFKKFEICFWIELLCIINAGDHNNIFSAVRFSGNISDHPADGAENVHNSDIRCGIRM
jgi:hypothetical protein